MEQPCRRKREQLSVIAIVKTDDEFRAVELRDQNGTPEVLWTRSRSGGETDWQAFAAECGLSVGSTDPTKSHTDQKVIIGFDSAGIAFYRVITPAVEEEEIEAIVKLQAESRLPLPVDQMELAWRTSPVKNGQIAVTIAASRKQNVQAFVNKIRSIQPTQILLDCEAVVKAWKSLFSEQGQNAVIINAGARNTQVCLVQNGQLSNAVTLDMGVSDFAEGQAEEVTVMTERFVHDVRSVIDLFGYERSAEMPVFVLSDGSATYVSLVSALRLEGLNARVVSPEPAKLTAQKELSVTDIYTYRVPLGLAMLALDTDADRLNLFQNVYTPTEEDKSRHWLYTPKVVYAITAAMIVLSILISYFVDVAKPSTIEKQIKASGSETDINLLMERQKLKKIVAQQRPDLLDLINEITTSSQNSQNNQRTQRPSRGGRGQNASIQLDTFHFKKGQPVLISGQASNNDQLYNFEQNLEEKTDIKEVKRTSTQNTSVLNTNSSPRGAGGGSRGTKFTITFHYKNFTK
jgi:hypothetical protein